MLVLFDVLKAILKELDLHDPNLPFFQEAVESEPLCLSVYERNLEPQFVILMVFELVPLRIHSLLYLLLCLFLIVDHLVEPLHLVRPLLLEEVTERQWFQSLCLLWVLLLPPLHELVWTLYKPFPRLELDHHKVLFIRPYKPLGNSLISASKPRLNRLDRKARVCDDVHYLLVYGAVFLLELKLTF